MGSDGDAFDRLLDEAERKRFSGWDFSWLDGRVAVRPPGWDYTERVLALARSSSDLLDMGTGGGEWLRALPYRPPRTVATEAWPPNIAVAGRNLRPCGVAVVADEGAADNADQADVEPRGRLPFRSGSFSLVVNRHEAFVASEVTRVLARGGHFLTQQVDAGNFDDYSALLGLDQPRPAPQTWLDLAVAQIEVGGLVVRTAQRGDELHRYADVGALAWYVKAISTLDGVAGGFTVAQYRPQLRVLHERIQRDGCVEAVERRFIVHATKPR